MASVYCGSCGAEISDSARFCRVCGATQIAASEPPPPPPPPPQSWRSPTPATPAPTSERELTVSILAIVGGATMCFIALYATVYLPLHYGYDIGYGESFRLGDIVALVSGAIAIAIGVLILARRSLNSSAAGIWLVVAGTPTLVMAVIWAFPGAFHLSGYPLPFYFATVYFTDIGSVELGQGQIGLPLVTGCAMVVAAGFATFASAAAARPVVR